MLVDTCLFSAESEMLELRLRTLASVVDAVVAVACTVTHQNEPADCDQIEHAFKTARTRFAGKLLNDCVRLHWCMPEVRPPFGERGGVGTPYYQKIERQHRDACAEAARAFTDDPSALVMISDVDEIPDPHAIGDRLRLLDQMGRPCEWLVLEQRFHSTALDLLHPQAPWLGTTMSRLRNLKPQAMRDARGELFEQGCTVKDAGWHLSFFGTDAERQRKLDTFSHAELRGVWDPVEARRTLRHANNEPLHKMTLDEIEHASWPRPLRDAEFSIPKHWWADA